MFLKWFLLVLFIAANALWQWILAKGALQALLAIRAVIRKQWLWKAARSLISLVFVSVLLATSFIPVVYFARYLGLPLPQGTTPIYFIPAALTGLGALLAVARSPLGRRYVEADSGPSP